MEFDPSVLTEQEEISLSLRSLYARAGYTQYKMGKFEEYDLYVRNKDFLDTDRIITFTDTNGKLKALKPDVTLSLIGSCKDEPGLVQKLYYNENVYRADDAANGFKEITHTGVECIGDLDTENINEVIHLAAKSLAGISKDSVLEISHLDILSEIMNSIDVPEISKDGILKCIEEKNPDQLTKICAREDIDHTIAACLRDLTEIYDTPKAAAGKLESIFEKLSGVIPEDSLSRLCCSLSELSLALESFEGTPEEGMIRIDFSVSSDLKYYNSLVFEGFIKGIPDVILSGGQYDKLMQKINRTSRGIGFAVYLNVLERLSEKRAKAPAVIVKKDDDFLNVALPKGRLGEKVYEMFSKAGYECPSILETNRKLIFENSEAKVRYFWSKPSDVGTYVERGAADIGVAGKDIIVEYEPDVYELLDLDTGKCRMCVAGPKDFKDDPTRTLIVATKFTNCALNYYSSLDRDINIIHLNGSIEIAPILGLSDVIVDIVETGTTLRENDLEIKDVIFPISARLIANRSSFKFKSGQIMELRKNLAAQIKEKRGTSA